MNRGTWGDRGEGALLLRREGNERRWSFYELTPGLLSSHCPLLCLIFVIKLNPLNAHDSLMLPLEGYEVGHVLFIKAAGFSLCSVEALSSLQAFVAQSPSLSGPSTPLENW